MALRCSIATGIVGFLGGILCRDKWSSKTSRLNAAGDAVSPEAGIPDTKDDQVCERMRFGFPGIDDIKHRDGYTLSYDRKNRVPRWVMEHLTPANLEIKETNLSEDEFFEDASVYKFFQSTLEDYKGSNFSRGHLAAAMNYLFNQKKREDTFALSNVAPQVEGFNNGRWKKLEEYALNKVKLHDNVYICTGTLFLPSIGDDGELYVKYKLIGANQVAVPTHFFKIIVCERNSKKCKNQPYEMETYLMPNDVIDSSKPLNEFYEPKEKIEKYAGMFFFHRLQRSQLFKINGERIICD